MMRNDKDIMKLRAHHLLCFHGFSGHGYDERFVENMRMMKERFLANPEMVIRIVASPDEICMACPNLGENGCFKNGDPDEELKTREMDCSIMETTGIKEGDVRTVREAFDSVEKTIDANALERICKTCEWLQVGHCRERIEIRFFK